MQTNHRRPLTAGAIFLLLAAACAMPGLVAPAAPTADANALGTIIAETAAAAARQTEAGGVSGPPAATPTPTAIQVATTGPAPVFSLHDTALVKQADGTSLLIDRKGGYQLVIPADWMAIRIGEQEYLSAFASQAATDPVIHDRLTRLQDIDLDVFRLEAIDIRPGHVVNGVITNMSVSLFFEDSSTLEEVDQSQTESGLPFDNFKEVSSSFQQTPGGHRILIRERTWDSIVPGETTYERDVFFSLPSGIVGVTISSNLSFKDTVLPEFDQVLSSLTLLNP